MIHRLGTVASTNLSARGGCVGDVFVAENQTAGRGRLDHRWQAESGKSLTFSVVLGVAGFPIAEVSTLPLVTGLAVARALRDLLSPCAISLKWPNDVLVERRKLCGILCERDSDNVIAGIGINVNQSMFPRELADRATSMAILSGHAFDRDAVLSSVLRELTRAVGEWREGGFASLHDDYHRYDCLAGRPVKVFAHDGDDEPIEGICGGVAPDGSLLVGDVPVWAGEAHISEIAS